MERYLRQTVLDEIGLKGQAKLKDARVLVIGMGGLGSPVLYYLTAAGIGTIGIIDFDRVSESNLNRQILHFTSDMGRPKIESGSEKLMSLNPEVKIIKYNLQVKVDNIAELIKPYDIIVDATDNFASRFLISDCCFFMKKLLVEGAVREFDGILLTIIPEVTRCYRCLYPTEPEPVPAIPGIIGATAGVIGSLQALEVIKLITNAGPIIDKILTFDGLTGSFREVNWSRKKECPLCGEKRTIMNRFTV